MVNKDPRASRRNYAKGGQVARSSADPEIWAGGPSGGSNEEELDEEELIGLAKEHAGGRSAGYIANPGSQVLPALAKGGPVKRRK